jgi:hypothetical protein
MTDHTAQFEQHRPILEGIACRMLGSRAEAEREAYTGWMTWHDGRPYAAITVDTDGTQILAVFVVLNPDKLARFGNAS